MLRRLLLIRYPIVGRRRLTAICRGSSTGPVFVACTASRYRRIRLPFAADVPAAVGTGHAAAATTLNVVPTVLLLGRCERNLRRQPVASDERAQIVVVLGWRWRRWPRLHYAGVKLLLEWLQKKIVLLKLHSSYEG